MENILNNKNLLILKKIAYYILVLSLSVCTVLSFINWQASRPEIIQLVLNLFYALRKFLSVPVLFIYEILFFINKSLLFKQDKTLGKKNLLCSLLFLLFTFLIAVFTKQTKLIYFLMMIYFLKDFEYRRILDIHITGKLFVLLVLIIGNVFGLVYIAEQRGNGFGMVHYNTLAQFLIFLMLALACRYNIKNDKKISFTALSLILIGLCIYPIDSRTPVVVVAMFVILLWLEKLYLLVKNKFSKAVELLFISFPILITILSALIGIAIVYWGVKMDGNLASRFIDFVNAYNKVGFSLFSRSITYGEGLTNGLFYFDNHYAKLLFDYGIVLSVIAYFGFVVSNIRIIKSNIYVLIVVMFCVYVYGVTGGLFDNELIIVLMACAFSKDIFNITNNKDIETIK